MDFCFSMGFVSSTVEATITQNTTNRTFSSTKAPSQTSAACHGSIPPPYNPAAARSETKKKIQTIIKRTSEKNALIC